MNFYPFHMHQMVLDDLEILFKRSCWKIPVACGSGFNFMYNFQKPYVYEKLYRTRKLTQLLRVENLSYFASFPPPLHMCKTIK